MSSKSRRPRRALSTVVGGAGLEKARDLPALRAVLGCLLELLFFLAGAARAAAGAAARTAAAAALFLFLFLAFFLVLFCLVFFGFLLALVLFSCPFCPFSSCPCQVRGPRAPPAALR